MAETLGNRISLEEAIRRVRDFFDDQCGGLLTFWHVLAATESLEKGVYVIRCGEHCLLENERRHEVWVDPRNGEVCHAHRID